MESIAPTQYGWGSWAVDRNDDGYYVRNSYLATVNDAGKPVVISGGLRVYAEDIPGYTAGIPNGTSVTPYATEDDINNANYGKYYQPVSIITPDKTPYEFFGLDYDAYVRSMGAYSATDI
ncbi:MAG: hypothetical protein IKR86_06010 [Candidatus Methanomethylophilaceae archaeon]|nr:hypothetical protein [Candidatus Methanomethylophilaceae archaeon]